MTSAALQVGTVGDRTRRRETGELAMPCLRATTKGHMPIDGVPRPTEDEDLQCTNEGYFGTDAVVEIVVTHSSRFED